MVLEVKVFKDFVINSPIWVASSHLTASVNSIERWQKIQPSVLTLKTTSQMGANGKKGRRYVFLMQNRKSLYTNGDKARELLNYTTASELLHIAKRALPNTKIGSSILMGEDYKKCLKMLRESDFFELNLKYAVRTGEGDNIHSKFELDQAQFSNVLKEVGGFIDTFAEYPCFIKLTREIDWLRPCKEFDDLIRTLRRHPKTGIIIANTRKWTVPSSVSGLSSELEGGVLAGGSLFEETYNIISRVADHVPREIPIIATGGIDSVESLVDTFRIGIKAVQICTAFHLNGFGYYDHLLTGLKQIHGQLKARSFDEFLDEVQSLKLVSLPAEYEYYGEFYKYPHFEALFNAKLLDISLVYGRTFTRINTPYFISRFSDSTKRTRIITMAPDSPCLEATARSLGREPADISARIKEAQQNWIKLYEEQGDPRHELEIYQHNKVPFHSGYITEHVALFVPYSMLGEGQRLPIYEFRAGTSEYKRLKREYDVLVEQSTRVRF